MMMKCDPDCNSEPIPRRQRNRSQTKQILNLLYLEKSSFLSGARQIDFNQNFCQLQTQSIGYMCELYGELYNGNNNNNNAECYARMKILQSCKIFFAAIEAKKMSKLLAFAQEYRWESLAILEDIQFNNDKLTNGTVISNF